MHIISPLSVDTCKPYIGRQLCAVLRDGRQFTGTLSEVNENGLIFQQAFPEAAILSTQSRKAKKQPQSLKQKAQTSAFGPGFGFSPFGGLLSWGSIALLFLLPFFFI